MYVFEHNNTKIKISINLKVMWSFFSKNNDFTHIKKFDKKISVKYFLIRHPTFKFLSFYKNKLYDFYGFNYLSSKLKNKLCEIYNIDFLKYEKFKDFSDESYKIFQTSKSFEVFVKNLDLLSTLDHHITPQKMSLDCINYEKLIKMESDLELLKEDFENLDLTKKYNISNSNNIISFLNKDLESNLYEIYKDDYSLGNYKLTL